MTVREIVNKYQQRLSNIDDLTLPEANNILVELSAIKGNINSELIKRHLEYNKKKLEILAEVKAVAKSCIKAETSDEWVAYQEVKGYREVAEDMTRALKYFIRSNQDDFYSSGNV